VGRAGQCGRPDAADLSAASAFWVLFVALGLTLLPAAPDPDANEVVIDAADPAVQPFCPCWHSALHVWTATA
jgi:hypothetical protein